MRPFSYSRYVAVEWLVASAQNGPAYAGIHPMALQPKSGLDLLLWGFLITRNKHTVGLIWTSDQPVAEASTYIGQHNVKHERKTSMPSAGFEPAIPATKRPQTYVFDSTATGIGAGIPYRNFFPQFHTGTYQYILYPFIFLHLFKVCLCFTFKKYTVTFKFPFLAVLVP
jgi:hypothetical protein